MVSIDQGLGGLELVPPVAAEVEIPEKHPSGPGAAAARAGVPMGPRPQGGRFSAQRADLGSTGSTTRPWIGTNGSVGAVANWPDRAGQLRSSLTPDQP